ncbi:hypothetical protein LTS18_012634, partial [Coniosporium uncinatum]
MAFAGIPGLGLLSAPPSDSKPATSVDEESKPGHDQNAPILSANQPTSTLLHDAASSSVNTESLNSNMADPLPQPNPQSTDSFTAQAERSDNTEHTPSELEQTGIKSGDVAHISESTRQLEMLESEQNDGDRPEPTAAKVTAGPTSSEALPAEVQNAADDRIISTNGVTGAAPVQTEKESESVAIQEAREEPGAEWQLDPSDAQSTSESS